MSRDGLVQALFMRDGTRAKGLMFECVCVPDGREDCVSKQDGRGDCGATKICAGEDGGEVLSLEKHDVMKILPLTTSSEKSLKTVLQWLHECCSTHADCPRPLTSRSSEVMQDIRFLHIQDSGVKLGEDMRPQRYAALSHCWGTGAAILKTTTHNLNKHTTQGISLDQLPISYQDAITVCRKLAISYLWIDSLCIVQNSLQDWRTQASRMADIYETAIVTIAASKAHNASQGCFVQTHWSYRGAMLPGFPGVVIRRVCIPPGVAFRSQDHHEDWPIYKRAWI